MTEYAYEGPTRSSITVSWSFETQNYPVDAGAPFSDPIDPIYQATIQAAFNRWSSVSGLTFVQVSDSPSAAIRIGFGGFRSYYTVGETVIRSIGGFLPNDTVVRLLDPTFDALAPDAAGDLTYADSDITLLQIATHEIGHAIGLDHTTDPTTIMYPVASALDQNLGAGDIEGINGLYPLYTVSSPDPIQVQSSGGTTYHFVVTRYNDPSLATTINYQVSGAGDPALTGTVAAPAAEFVGGVDPSGQLTFAPGVSSVALSVAVAGTTTAQPDQSFALSLSSTGATAATARGTLYGIILQNGASSANGTTLPIYRFFDESDGTHFFTSSAGERNAVIETRPDLVYEGVQLNALAKLGSDPAAIPVFRFFDSVHGTHFYTASTLERDTVVGSRSDLTYEGVGFYEDATAQAGDTAVYRFFDTQSGTHFLTSAATERASILATRPDYVDEGVAFYAPASA